MVVNADKSQEEVLKQAREAVFHQYKFLDYLFVSEENEKDLIQKLLKEEEQKEKEEQERQRLQEQQ